MAMVVQLVRKNKRGVAMTKDVLELERQDVNDVDVIASSADDAVQDDIQHFFAMRSITVPPKGSKALGAGVYAAGEVMPEFAVTLEPNIGEQMGVSLERLDIPGKGKYMPLYQFHNFGDKPCRVTISRRD